MWDDDAPCGGQFFELATYVFLAGSLTCALLALHRIADALKLGSRARTLSVLGEELAPDERAELTRKVKAGANRYL